MINRKERVIMDKSKLTAQQTLNAFFAEKRGDNLAEDTLSIYRTHLKYFFEVLEIEDDESLFLLSEADLTFFKTTILSEKSDVTSATYCRSVRSFIYWARDNGYLKNTNITIKIPKAQEKVKETYTEEELSILLKDPRPCSATQYQSYVFVNFVIATGLRLSSILDLRVFDYNAKDGCIIVNKTKNNNAQTRYINKQMQTILNEYIERFELDTTDYLFCNTSGERANRRTFQGQIARYNKKKGIKKTSIHLFRHTFAKNFIQNGGSIRDLQLILDHSTVQITEEYLRDLGLNSKATVEIYNPQKQHGKKTAKSQNRKRIIH